MVSRWLSRVAVASAMVSAGMFAGASVGWGDPPGNNGTVKINSQDVDSSEDISNVPHVPCDFQVEFFGFDEGQTATITFTIHPPSGDGDVLLSETKTISNDPAAGGLNDVDEVFPYSGTTFGLDRFTAQPQQGFHVKLTIESSGVPGGVKHKVFWLQCAPTTPPTKPPTKPPTTPPTTSPTTPATTPPASTQPPTTPGVSTSPAAVTLPVTGAGVGYLIAAGAALIGGGAALLLLRRRRTANESAAELQ
jgi:LPXTG-motif cell wall-anchored protein